MKKIIVSVLALIMVVFLTACNSDNNGMDFVGTWQIDCIEYEGSKFSVAEWNNMEQDDLSDFYIIFKEGGKAYVYDDEYGELVNWLSSDDSIMIGDEKCSIVDGMICFEYYGDKLYLAKTSENQEIPSEEQETEPETESDIDETATVAKNSVKETEITSNDNVDWKEFLSEYEAWVDDYIEFLEEYNENPTDLTLLSEYTELIEEMTEWSDKADEVELEIDDPDEALEYTNELLRIVGKLAEAGY